MHRAASTPLGHRAAGLLGVLLRYLLVAGRPVVDALPGALGVMLVAYGLGLAWRPLGFIAVGLALIIIDWRSGGGRAAS
jgi:hypothetical protein